MSQGGLEAIHEQILGGLFVLVFAFRRFNTPRTNRSSTTAARYYTAITFYCLFGLALYALLVGFPNLLHQVLGVELGMSNTPLPGFATHLSSPLLVALLLTVLLPSLPIVSSVDDWIRTSFLALASIPLEVQILTAQLQRARFHLSKRAQEDVAERLMLEGFDVADHTFDGGSGVETLWTRIAGLMAGLDEWRRQRRFAGFVASFGDDFAALQTSYRQLGIKARKLFESKRLLAAQNNGADDGRHATDDEQEFRAQANALLGRIHEFVSRGVLQCELTDGSRARQLQRLGFQAQFSRTRLTLNQLVALFLGILVSSATVLALMDRSENMSMEAVLGRAALVASLYVVAVWFAVYPKRRWKLARVGRDGSRPVAFYFVAGALAGLASRFISLGFANYAQHETILHHLRTTYPWFLISFVTAATTAFHTDNRPTEKLTRLRLRWIEALSQGMATSAAAWVAYYWTSTLPSHQEFPLSLVLAVPAAFGFAIGFFVPTWYREAPHHAERRGGDRRQQDLGRSPERRVADRRRVAAAHELGQRIRQTIEPRWPSPTAV